MPPVGKLFAIAAIFALVVGVSPWPTSMPGNYTILIKNRGYGFPLDYWAFSIGAVFAAFAAVYYWFPIFFLRSLSSRTSELHFWFSAVAAFGFLLLAPGLESWSALRDAAVPSQRAVISALVIASISTILFLSAQLIFLIGLFWSAIYGKRIGR